MKKLAFVFMFLGCVACGDNSQPNIDSFTFDNFDMFPDKFAWCPLPPPEQMEAECYFECTPIGRGRHKTWRCTEICECAD